MSAHGADEELRALRAELARFRLAFDNVPAAIAYYERTGNTCIYANRSYCEMFGRDRGLGPRPRRWRRSSAPRRRSAIQPRVDQALNERVAARYERVTRDAEGRQRQIEVHLRAAPRRRRRGDRRLRAHQRHHAPPPRRSRGARKRGAAEQVHARQRRGHRLPQGRLHHRRQPAAAGAAGLRHRRHARPPDAGLRGAGPAPARRRGHCRRSRDHATTAPCCTATARASRWSSSCARCTTTARRCA